MLEELPEIVKSLLFSGGRLDNQKVPGKLPEFNRFPKIPRFSRTCIVTEKIDGTNGLIYIGPGGGEFFVGNRRRWITPEEDNHGFAKWAYEHEEELRELGPGRHFGEWWGKGIQRGYGLTERRFSLFNVSRWAPHGAEPKLISISDEGVKKFQRVPPACCHLVPVIYEGEFGSNSVNYALSMLQVKGSYAAPGFMKPEGIVIFHTKGQTLFKKTILKDGEPKRKGVGNDNNISQL